MSNNEKYTLACIVLGIGWFIIHLVYKEPDDLTRSIVFQAATFVLIGMRKASEQ